MSPTAFLVVVCFVAASTVNGTVEFVSTAPTAVESVFVLLGTTIKDLSQNVAAICNDISATNVTIADPNSSATCAPARVYTNTEYSVSIVYLYDLALGCSSALWEQLGMPNSCSKGSYCTQYLEGETFTFTEYSMSDGRWEIIDSDYVIVVMGERYVFYNFENVPFGITY